MTDLRLPTDVPHRSTSSAGEARGGTERTNQRRAPFDVRGCDGSRTTVADVDSDTTVGDLARRIFGRRDALTIDGCEIAAATRVVESPLWHGSTVEQPGRSAWRGRQHPAPGDHVDDLVAGCPLVVATTVLGVDAGRAVALDAGEHIVGRAVTAAARLEDQSVEPHHVLIDVAANGECELLQVAGAVPIAVDGAAIDGRVHLGARAMIGVGSSTVELAAAGPDTVAGDTRPGRRSMASRQRMDPWRASWTRPPRAVSSSVVVAIEAPRTTPPSSTFGGVLTPALLALVGAVVLALVFGQPMFFLFGALGAIVAVGTWGAQRIGVARERRGSDRVDRGALAAFAAELDRQHERAVGAHLDRTPTLVGAVQTARAAAGVGVVVGDRDRIGAELWRVRPDHPDAWIVSIGSGDLSWQPSISGIEPARSSPLAADVWAVIDRSARLGEVPVPVSLADGSVIAVVGGDPAAAVARGMLLQLAVASGPADWQLAIVSDNPHRWSGLAWLPYGEDIGRVPLIAAAAEVADLLGRIDGDARHLVVVTDQPELLAVRTSPLRRLVASDRSCSIVVLCADEAELPALATGALVVGHRGVGRWIADTSATSLGDAVRIAGASRATTDEVASLLARWTDPEAGNGATGLSREVELTELLRDVVGDGKSGAAANIAHRWMQSSGRGDQLSVPLGLAADGVVELDLVTDGPHMLIGGTTGAGKSELLRSMVLGLACRWSPDEVTFVLVDFKGGSTFDGCSTLPHVVGIVTDLDGSLADRALRSLDAELRRREHLLRDAHVTDLAQYRLARSEQTDADLDRLAVLSRLVVIVDEFATLATQQPAFLGALLGIAQRGRSLGVHLVLATQRPSGVVNDDIRANTAVRLALRVQDRADALDVVGDPSAAALPRSIPGRAVMRLGSDATVMFQTATAGSDAQRLTDAINDAVTQARIERPHVPWLAPLGEMNESDWCRARGEEWSHAVGVVDDPDHQARRPLVWAPVDGHLLLAGMPGSGTTTALLAVAAACAARDPHAELVVIDALGDPRLGLLDSLPQCVGVVRARERERVSRALAMVAAEVGHRKSDPGRVSTALIVCIDGLGPLRADLDAADDRGELDELHSIVTDGRSVGVTVVATVSGAAAVPVSLLASMACRWVFALADPLDASYLGLSSGAITIGTPGRVRDVGSGLEAQLDQRAEAVLQDLACRAPGPAHKGESARHRIDTLPTHIGSSSLPDPSRVDDDVTLPIGRSFVTLAETIVTVPGGEHVLIVGPPRSGRSTALATSVQGWQRATPDGRVVSIAVRRGSIAPGTVFTDAAAACAAASSMLDDGARVLVVVDDAEAVDDPSGALQSLASARHERCTIVAAGRPDALRVAYGHWTGAVRRSRIGLVMAGGQDIDGDLFGSLLPRRLPVAPRPGLAWLLTGGVTELCQVATPDALDDDAGGSPV